MPYLDFFVDFAVSGQIAGAGLNSRPAVWSPVLGGDHLEGSFSDHHLIRGFGFIEANFADHTGEWLCYLVHVKPLKLDGSPGAVPPPIAERYGQFPAARITFDEVADAVAAAGAEVRHLPRVAKYAGEMFWVPRGKVMFEVVSPERLNDFDDVRVGDIIEVTANDGVDFAPDYGTRYR